MAIFNSYVSRYRRVLTMVTTRSSEQHIRVAMLAQLEEHGTVHVPHGS